MGPFFITISCPDRDTTRIILQGPYKTQIEPIAIIENLRKIALEEDIIEDELNDTHPHLIICDSAGLPVTFTVVEAFNNFEEALKALD